MWEIFQQKVSKTRVTDLELSTTPLANDCRNNDIGLIQAWPTPFSVAVSFRPDQLCPFCTPSVAIVSIRCNQLDSNMAILEATVKVR